MNVQVIEFPTHRVRELDWDDLPDYWDTADKSYYSFDIKRGMSPEKAFRKHDLSARAPNVLAGLPFKTESEDEYLARLEAIALSPEAARRSMGVRK